MPSNRNLAPALAFSTVLLAGCSGAPATPAEQAKASSEAAQEAQDSQPYFEVKYYPNGTRELTEQREISSGAFYPSVLQFCFDQNTIQSITEETFHGVGGDSFVKVETACQDLKLTPEDNLPVPGR